MFFACHEDYTGVGSGETVEEAVQSLMDNSNFHVMHDDLKLLYVIEGKQKKVVPQPAYRIEGDVE